MNERPTRALDIAVLVAAGSVVVGLGYVIGAVMFGWPL